MIYQADPSPCGLAVRQAGSAQRLAPTSGTEKDAQGFPPTPGEHAVSCSPSLSSCTELEMQTGGPGAGFPTATRRWKSLLVSLIPLRLSVLLLQPERGRVFISATCRLPILPAALEIGWGVCAEADALF